MVATYLGAGGYAADGRWMGTDSDGWKEAKKERQQRKDRVTKAIKMTRGMIRRRIKQVSTTGRTGAASSRCAKHFQP